MAKRYYAAYGSNLNIKQMGFRCPNSKVLGHAYLKDYELLFKGSQTGAYLTVEPKENSKVPIGVWEVSEEDELSLDRYEGYPAFYYKKEIKVQCRIKETGKWRWIKVFIYIMDERREIGVPSKFYMDTCLKGYRGFGFDEKTLKAAYEKCEKAVKQKPHVFNMKWIPPKIINLITK